jgi:hypothetical protein
VKKRKRDKKRMQKISEKKAKDKKLKEIMTTLDQNSIKDNNIYDLLTSSSTMKKDVKKYNLAKEKLHLPDTSKEIKLKKKMEKKAEKRKAEQEEQENATRVRL